MPPTKGKPTNPQRGRKPQYLDRPLTASERNKLYRERKQGRVPAPPKNTPRTYTQAELDKAVSRAYQRGFTDGTRL